MKDEHYFSIILEDLDYSFVGTFIVDNMTMSRFLFHMTKHIKILLFLKACSICIFKVKTHNDIGITHVDSFK